MNDPADDLEAFSPADDLRGHVPRRLFLRHVAAALHEPDERIRWLFRSGQLPSYATHGQWRWTTVQDLATYAAQHRAPLDWDAVACLELGLENPGSPSNPGSPGSR